MRTSSYREFTAMTRCAKGGTEAVTVNACSDADARERLLKMGYHEVLWVL